MRIHVVVLFVFLGVCSCSDRDDTIPDFLHGSWYIQNSSGGLAGIDQDFEAEAISWTFDSEAATLTVVNNSEDTAAMYEGLDPGTYTYSILETEDQNFLIIDEVEFSGLDFMVNQLILDQNKMSSGTGTDGFILLFMRQ